MYQYHPTWYFSHLYYTKQVYITLTTHFENLLHPHVLFELSNNNTVFFPIQLFAKFSFPSSVFSPSLCLFRQYECATVQGQQTKTEADRSNHCIFASSLGSFLNTTVETPWLQPSATPAILIPELQSLSKSFKQPFGFICDFCICFQLRKYINAKQRKTWKHKTEKEQTCQGKRQQWESDINREESKVMTNPQYDLPVTFVFWFNCPWLPINDIRFNLVKQKILHNQYIYIYIYHIISYYI